VVDVVEAALQGRPIGLIQAAEQVVADESGIAAEPVGGSAAAAEQQNGG
jgi:hypothetical protein